MCNNIIDSAMEEKCLRQFCVGATKNRELNYDLYKVTKDEIAAKAVISSFLSKSATIKNK